MVTTTAKAGQKAWDTSRHDRLGTSNKFAKTKNTVLERLEFQVEMVANRQEHALVILQEVKRLIKPVGTIDIVKNENSFKVAYQFETGELITENQQSDSNFENYILPFKMTLFIESDLNSEATVVNAIGATVLNYSGSS